MKYCSRPFRFLHLDPDGEVRACGWTSNSLGNILEDGLDKVWNGEAAEKVRNSIRDGSFAYCQKAFCPYLANNTLPDINKDNFEEIIKLEAPAFPPYEVLTGIKNVSRYEDLFKALPSPVEFDFAYDKICNHACPTCRNGILCVDDKERKAIQDTSSILATYLDNIEYLDICGAGDVFASKYMMDVLKSFNPVKEDAIIDLETNGALFDEKHWEQISHLSKNKLCVNLTTNSWDKDTYTYLNGNVEDYDHLMHNVAFLKSLREQGKISCLTLSMVIQDRNFRELPEFIRKSLDEFGADYVNLKPVYRWFCLAEEDFWFKDVANPKHPYHADYKRILEDPIFKDSRVFWWDGYNVHDPKQHPAHKSDYIAQMLLKFFYTEDYKEKLAAVIDKMNLGRIAVYGAGMLGEVFCNSLKDSDIKIKYVVDKYRNDEEFCGFNMKNFLKFNAADIDSVIVTPIYYLMTIKQDLRNLGFRGNVVDVMDIIKEI